MRAGADRDDARVVNHLVGDRDGAGRLHDAHVGVVDGREDRAGNAAADAALPQAQVLRTIEDGGAAKRAQPGKRPAAAAPRPRPRRAAAAPAAAACRQADRSRATCGATLCRARASAAAGRWPTRRRRRCERSAVSRSKSALSDASCLSACAWRCAYSASVRNRRSPYCACRSNGTLSSASLLNVPCRSGSPHGVLGTAGPCADAHRRQSGRRELRHRDHTPRPHLGPPRWSCRASALSIVRCERACSSAKNRSNLPRFPRWRHITAADAREAGIAAQRFHLRIDLNRVEERGVLVYARSSSANASAR